MVGVFVSLECLQLACCVGLNLLICSVCFYVAFYKHYVTYNWEIGTSKKFEKREIYERMWFD